MLVDMETLFQDHGISYDTSGKNVQAGWINIQCPFCDDHSNHLGYNTAGGYFHCWNCGHHPTKQVLRLILGISYYEIDALMHDYSDYKLVLDNLNKKKITHKNSDFELPGIEHLCDTARKYLRKRNFDPVELQEKYHLRDGYFAGDWKYRIIIPVFFNKKAVSFQARSYVKKIEPKYKNLKNGKGIIDLKNILFNLDNCRTDTIGVLEGVFDVFRFGNNFCSSFGTSMTDYQIKLLSNFKNIYFLYDSEEEAQKKAKQHATKLVSLGCNVEIIDLQLDEGIDPADLDPFEVMDIKEEIGI